MMSRELEVIRTDDGQFYWLNPETNVYQLVELEDSEEPQQQNAVGAVVKENNVLRERSSNVNAAAEQRLNMWSKQQTIYLLQKYANRKEDFENPRFKKIEIFKEIAENMKQEMGWNFSPLQCQNRMKTLNGKSKEIKDHNNTTGNDRKDWEYLDIMEELMGRRPSVVPSASASSIKINAQGSSSSKSREKAAPPRDCTNNNEEPAAKRARQTPRSELQKFLQTYKEEEKEKEKERLEVLDRHHRENASLFRELIDVLKKMTKM